MEALRGLYVLIEFVDKASEPIRQVSKSVTDFKRNLETTVKPIKDLQTETMKVKQTTKPVQDLASAFDRVKVKASEYVTSMKTKLSHLTEIVEKHKKAIAAIGTALSAIGYGGFRVFGGSAKDFERAILEMQARTTLTTEQLKEMTEVVKDLARANSDSFKTISEVVTILTERYGYLGRETKETAQAILDFAKVTGTDAVTAANSISVAMKAFSIPASQMYEVTDTLIAAQQRFGVQSAYIIELLKSNAAPLKMLNLSFSEAVGLLSALEANGVNVSRALMGLRSAAAKGIDVKKALRELAEIEDSTERTRRAVEIFGSYAGPGLARVLEGGTEALDKFMLKMDDVRGTTKKASETIDKSLSEQIGILKNNLTILAVEIGKTLLPVMKKVVAILRTLTDTFEKLPTPIKGLIGVVAGLVTVVSAVVGPLLVQVAAITWLGLNYKLKATILGLTTTLRTFAVSLWTTLAPLLLWIALIGGLIMAILLLQDVLVKGWERSYLGQFVNWLLEKLPFLKPIAEGVGNAINWMRQSIDWLSSEIGEFVSWIQQGLDTLGPLKYAILGPAGAILFLAQNFDKVTSAIKNFITWIKNAWKTLTENPIFNLIKTLTPFGAALKAYEIVTRKTIETKTINLIETSKKEELLRRNVTEEEIRRKAIEQYEYIKSIKLQGVTNEEEIKKQLETKFGEVIINPEIIPYVGKPEYDKKFYEEGSIKLKVEEPVFKPIIEKPDMSWLDTLFLHIKPVVEAIKLPSLYAQALIKPIIADIPKLPELVGVVKYIPKLIKPELPSGILKSVETLPTELIHATYQTMIHQPMTQTTYNQPITINKLEIKTDNPDQFFKEFIRKLKLKHYANPG
jgi:phage-related minor tail protein